VTFGVISVEVLDVIRFCDDQFALPSGADQVGTIVGYSPPLIGEHCTRDELEDSSILAYLEGLLACQAVQTSLTREMRLELQQHQYYGGED
jgi:hypothetical protein